MENNKKIELNEEELEGAAGGGGKTRNSATKGTMCMFKYDENSFTEHRDGATRRRCLQTFCTYFISGEGYYECKCWGTPVCVNRWHRANDCDHFYTVNE